MNSKNLTPRKKEQTDTDWWMPFLESLRHTPNISKAARIAGISRQLAYTHRAEFPAFASAWDDALKEGVEHWEELAAKRAFEGLIKPIMYEGQVVHEVQEFSDTLAIFLLKAHAPEKYRERMDVRSDTELTVRIKFDEDE